ncbi:MAG: hypothetical protein AAAB35_21665 [Phyllobacterium sp.]|uniref:hypothetical protein n=1 Tax=Phyllobacterium sp. TaxID=1871046 RepID=UPI0030F0B6AD
MTFLDDDNPNYSKLDGELMQCALDNAAERLGLSDKNDPELNTLARFIRAAFIIGNRDAAAMAEFAIDSVIMRRKRNGAENTAP